MNKYPDGDKLNRALSFVFLCFLVISCFSVTYSFSGYLANAQSVASSPNGAPSFNDEFNTTVLNSRWTVIDPTGSSTFSLTSNAGYLRITSQPNMDLWQISKNYNAPRIELTGISGDFVAETKILAMPNQQWECAGIYIWKDVNNFLRFERYYANSNETISLTIIKNGQAQQSFLFNTALNPTYLKVNRISDVFTGLYSADGTNWMNFANYTLPVSDPISIGLYVVNFGPTVSFSADFDYFRMTGGNIQPIATTTPTPNPPNPSPNISQSPTSNPTSILTPSPTSLIFPSPSSSFSPSKTSQSNDYILIYVVAFVIGVFAISITLLVNQQKNKRTREKKDAEAKKSEEKKKREAEEAKKAKQKSEEEAKRKEEEDQKKRGQPNQPKPSSDDPYEILGIPKTATKQQAKEAFWNLSQIWHPDKFVTEDERVKQMANEKYIKIKDAYEQIVKRT